MTLALIVAGVFASIGTLIWMFRTGKRSAEADVMEEINDDARKATAIREAIEAKPIDTVRSDLAKRVRRPF